MKKPFRVAMAAMGISLSTAGCFGAMVRANNIPVQNQKLQDAPSLESLDEELSTAPINARVDNVWHLIPGLAGWDLNVQESEAQTKRLNDGKTHLVWHEVKPKTSAASLRAEPVYRGPAGEKSISLMVNVSWGEEYVPAMLKALRAANAHATFFLDGQWVKKHPELAKQIASSGHAIGSHGTGHPDFRKLSDAKLAYQLDGTNDVIKSVTGKTVHMIAPPSGAYDERLVKMAKARHMYTIMWTADTVDWRRPPADVILQRAKKGLQPGCLLLMHPTATTAQALPQILKMIQASGYHTKTVEDVVFERPATKPPSTLSDNS